MQYLIVAYDYEDALTRRAEVRDIHLKGTYKLIDEGKVVQAGPIMEGGNAIGSVIIVNFDNEDEYNRWLENEPYVTNGVWDMGKLQKIPIQLLEQK